MIEITTYIQDMRAQGGGDRKYFGVRSSGYSGDMNNRSFVQERFFGGVCRAEKRQNLALMRSQEMGDPNTYHAKE